MDSSTSSRVCIVDYPSIEKIDLEEKGSDVPKEGAWNVGISRPHSPVNVAYKEDTPPDGGYGWVCTACVFLINAHTWGPSSAWGVFLNYYLHNSTFPGSTQLQFALIGGLSLSQSLIIAPLISYVNKHMGSRFTLGIGSIVASAALLAASFSTEIWHLFVTMSLFGYGIGFLYIPATAMLPPWFSTRRSLAVGIASSGAGVGGLVYNLVTERAIASLGVHNAYRVLAGVSLVINLICSLLLKSRSTRSPSNSQHIFDYRSLGHMEVLLVIMWGAATELGYVTLFFSMPAYASSIGLSSAQGSIAGALLNLGLGVGRPVVGWMSDRMGRINIAMFMAFFCGLLCLSIWMAAASYGVLLAFALLAGTACGTFWATVGPVLADIVGISHLAQAFDIICFALVLPATFAEPVALQIASQGTGEHSYRHTQAYVGCMFIVGGLCLLVLRSWKICDNQKPSEDGRESESDHRSTWQEWRQYLWLLSTNLVQPRKV